MAGAMSTLGRSELFVLLTVKPVLEKMYDDSMDGEGMECTPLLCQVLDIGPSF